MLDLLEELDLAAVLIDSEARVVAMTAKVADIQDLSSRPGKPVRHWDGSTEERIKAYLKKALKTDRWQTGAPVPLVLNGRRRRPLVVKAMPIRQRPLKYAKTAEAIIIFIDLEANPAPSPQLLRYIFGFTPAEARLASCLGAGESISQSTRSLHISLGTARQQLKAIFSKTGCRRQAELLALLARLTLVKPGEAEPSPESWRSKTPPKWGVDRGS